MDSELKYQTLMYLVKQMLQEDIITPEEYESICFKYADHFKPRTGSLVARNEILH